MGSSPWMEPPPSLLSSPLPPSAERAQHHQDPMKTAHLTQGRHTAVKTARTQGRGLHQVPRRGSRPGWGFAAATQVRLHFPDGGMGGGCWYSMVERIEQATGLMLRAQPGNTRRVSRVHCGGVLYVALPGPWPWVDGPSRAPCQRTSEKVGRWVTSGSARLPSGCSWGCGSLAGSSHRVSHLEDVHGRML